MRTPYIRFAHGALGVLRGMLLEDTSREHFAMLLARREAAPDGREVFVVQDAMLADEDDLICSSLAQVRPSKDFVARVLAMAQQDMLVNAIIDVHTHPFAADAWFSSVDDADEQQFSQWLQETLGPQMGYASIVFSQQAYQARVWHGADCVDADVKPANPLEAVPKNLVAEEQDTEEMQSRTALALGVDTLRRITDNQLVVLAGVGGLGSVMAEQLVRSGFARIGLIDADTLELTNLNRFAGGYQDDIGRLKVDVVRAHLEKINPQCHVESVSESVESAAAQALMAAADWIVVSTDSHSSRAAVQNCALQYGVSLMSVGVNITVEKGDEGHRLADQSGEVITLPHGSGMCLHCLGRIKPYVAAAEANPDSAIRTGLVQKGYVRGIVEKEPAVLPLNSSLASIAVQTLLDQYRAQASPTAAITVFESHNGFACYADTASLEALPGVCSACGRNVDAAAGEQQRSAA